MSDLRIIHGDALEELRKLEAGSVDAVVTDPPYGLRFMGKRWDYDVPSVDVWRECLRVLKPGAHLLAFAGTRTQHRMCCRIEDAGFDIRDMIAWVYSSGFPKSLDVSKAIDKAAGAEREVVGKYAGATNIGRREDGKRGYGCDGQFTGGTDTTVLVTAPATPEAARWAGWGTALKPAFEPITVARKPLDGTVAANVLAHGTGALNIDGCRIGAGLRLTSSGGMGRKSAPVYGKFERDEVEAMTTTLGRFPANLIHDGSDEVTRLFPGVGGECAARFFYTAKATALERDACLGGFEEQETRGGGGRADRGYDRSDPEQERLRAAAAAYGAVKAQKRNHHPTVKPLALMTYLVRLVTPPGGTVLDPYVGSGTTCMAARNLGLLSIGIELNAEYIALAERRCSLPWERAEIPGDAQASLFGGAS